MPASGMACIISPLVMRLVHRLATALLIATSLLLLVPVVRLATQQCDADTCMGGSLSRGAKHPETMVAAKQFVEATIKSNKIVVSTVVSGPTSVDEACVPISVVEWF